MSQDVMARSQQSLDKDVRAEGSVTAGTPSDEELQDFLSGRLSAVSSSRVERYLATSSSASSRLERLSAPEDSFARRIAVGQSPTIDWKAQQRRSARVEPSQRRSPSADSDAGQVTLPEADIGNYRLIEKMGAGGMGTVYKAHDMAIGRDVALKILNPEHAGDRSVVKRFLREARAAGRINHPNVVPILTIGAHQDQIYLVMELMQGGSIQQRLAADSPLSWLVATRMIADACRGLAAAHRMGLVHRDIKPDNLLLTTTGHIKVADFGLVKANSSDSATTGNMFLGTPHYMSPEQCRVDKVDHRSDVYSLGATYYTMLCGRRPYEDCQSPLHVMSAHCYEEVPDPRTQKPEVPEACARIAMRAMAKSPHNRYPDCDEMLADLEAAVESRGTVVPPNALPQVPAAEAERRPNGRLGVRRRLTAALALVSLAAMSIPLLLQTLK